MGGEGMLIALGVVVIAVGWGVVLYNKLVVAKHRVSEGWSGVDVQLRRRANLIPNLVESVPSNIVANLFRFRTTDYFEVEDASERAVPKTGFASPS